MAVPSQSQLLYRPQRRTRRKRLRKGRHRRDGRDVMGLRQLLQAAPAGAAEMPSWLNGFALPAINSSAVGAAPGKPGECLHFFLE